MAMDRGLIQRMVGALVLIALAVIFVPMLFNREDDARRVEVDAPAMPQTPAMPDVEVQPVEVPEPAAEPFPEEFEIIEEGPETEAQVPAEPITAPPAVAEPTPTPPAERPEPEQRLDAANLPVSWSVQLASLSNRESAEALTAKLRSQGYNAYVRTFEGMNRVFVGPLVERAEANRLRDVLERQQKLKGFVVRFKPEES
ncbi:SPOR domain-containing protein [Stutzerimonas nitrititolerans]|uniref:SPOR domain-containing protein n=2 Tax=Stutzerimonas nitrititolerans TaxID=2482751 RepID=UPI000F768958|nr:SPOR domain-containing protein [Stutzerimonas nitrititolerans]MBA1236276.1 SPOR domain-containing protein [Stutzerimonas stutzeri]MBT1120899.1 SPOR domain-containing protein [Stutzerimonas nitrititolerans]RRV20109.1 SPOR domain-containing protein [Pseudomonas sp. s199]WAD27723.1 SPOR domain-containing protein [Pseudomonadaceae bacterium T75]